MRLLLVVIIVFLFSLFAYSEEPYYQYPKLALYLKGDKIVLEAGPTIYTFPPANKDEYAGIKKVIQEDVDGDGEKEFIISVQQVGVNLVRLNNEVEELPNLPYCCILVCKQRGTALAIQCQMAVGQNSPDFQLADVNKDGIKDVIASGFEIPHWRHLKIASWKNGKYAFLWDKGESESFVEQRFRMDKDGNAEIKVGVPKDSKIGWRFSDEPAWEIWIWNGKKFELKEIKQ
jgi:hypothetical protein